jgi:hypothetical protein
MRYAVLLVEITDLDLLENYIKLISVKFNPRYELYR